LQVVGSLCIYFVIQKQAEKQEKWRSADKGLQIMKNMHETDPRDDKTRIQDAKGGLLRDTYLWILDHDHFRKWRRNRQSQLLWSKDNPGKGKTMCLAASSKNGESTRPLRVLLLLPGHRGEAE
jgi:hypothetical protein